jgi:hypothetical protein
LNPAGTFILAIGSLSAGVAMGNGGTGAIAAPGPVLGRPTAQKGTSSSLAGGGAGVLCCWAVAGNTTAIRIRRARPNASLRRVVEAVMAVPLEFSGLRSATGLTPGPAAL